MVNFQAENCDIPAFVDDSVKVWLEKVVKSHKFILGDLNYLFCDDDYILTTNQNYLNHDYYTDIITFDYSSNNLVSGDLVISLETVKTNSEKFCTSYQNELLRVIIHGVLHLCGFKDKTEEQSTLMRQLEEEALKLYTTFA